MQKRKLGRSGPEIAPLVFGGNVFGWTADEATSFKLLDRFIERGLNTIDTADVYSSYRDVQRAARVRDQAGLHSATKETAVLAADLARTKAAVKAAQAEKAAAELALSHSQVLAPVSGVVVQRAARVGGYARVGEPLLTLVPLDAVYVEANYRETQLARVRVGQAVDVEVDALPGVRLKGHVESLAPASGVSFSPVAGHNNASGNFTKITQRLPVRIQLEPGQHVVASLRVGMSVRPTIHVDAAPAGMDESAAVMVGAAQSHAGAAP